MGGPSEVVTEEIEVLSRVEGTAQGKFDVLLGSTVSSLVLGEDRLPGSDSEYERGPVLECHVPTTGEGHGSREDENFDFLEDFPCSRLSRDLVVNVYLSVTESVQYVGPVPPCRFGVTTNFVSPGTRRY